MIQHFMWIASFEKICMQYEILSSVENNKTISHKIGFKFSV